jgi:Calcineurin-like phosphoesterase
MRAQHDHVDCEALPTCLNIMGTYCGWCQGNGSTNGVGQRGTASGPTTGTCPQSSWIWDHQDCPTLLGPQQLRLAHQNFSSDAMVLWASTENTTGVHGAYIRVAGSGSSFTAVPAVTWLFDVLSDNPLGAQYLHKANFSGLVGGTTYEYYVSSDLISSPTSTFTAKRVDNGTYYMLFLGDMGRYGGGFVLQDLEREVNQTYYPAPVDAVVHVGDFAYDLFDDGGQNGDAFLQRIEAIASRVAYMTAVGNHEIEAETFFSYRNRFNHMPLMDTLDGFQMFHSWTIGPAVFLALSSELYFTVGPVTPADQVAWIEAEMARIHADPELSQKWVIAYIHRPYVPSDGAVCVGIVGSWEKLWREMLYLLFLPCLLPSGCTARTTTGTTARCRTRWCARGWRTCCTTAASTSWWARTSTRWRSRTR